MNSFRSDIARSVISVRSVVALSLVLAVLYSEGFDSQLYQLCVPFVCTLPYSCAFIDEYRSGFARLALCRTSTRAYIWGKFFACAIAGGAVEAGGVWIFSLSPDAYALSPGYALIFLSGALWASAASTLAAVSGSKYVAYGGSFVLYYLLTILNERYFRSLYFLNPHEWYVPEHMWSLGETGIMLLLVGMLAFILLIYELITRRRLGNV